MRNRPRMVLRGGADGPERADLGHTVERGHHHRVVHDDERHEEDDRDRDEQHEAHHGDDLAEGARRFAPVQDLEPERVGGRGERGADRVGPGRVLQEDGAVQDEALLQILDREGALERVARAHRVDVHVHGARGLHRDLDLNAPAEQGGFGVGARQLLHADRGLDARELVLVAIGHLAVQLAERDQVDEVRARLEVGVLEPVEQVRAVDRDLDRADVAGLGEAAERDGAADRHVEQRDERHHVGVEPVVARDQVRVVDGEEDLHERVEVAVLLQVVPELGLELRGLVGIELERDPPVLWPARRFHALLAGAGRRRCGRRRAPGPCGGGRARPRPCSSRAPGRSTR